MENPLLIWAIICLLGALVLFFVEVFVPSGGILGVLSSVCLIASIVLFFGINRTLGLVMSVVCLAALPFLFALAIKVWPTTPIARMLTLRDPNEQNDQAADAPSAVDTENQDLIGAEGIAMNGLHPVGSCRFGNKKYDCIAEGRFIEKGQTVKAVGWSGSQLKVRAKG